MTKRSAVCVAFVLVVSVFSSSNASNSWKFRDSKTQQPRPHIVFIMADDLGWNDVSFHGSEQIPTPNIDTLASAGIILNNYYVNPICTPSRSSLMTGRLTTQLGMQHDVISMDEPWGLPLNVTLLPEHLGRLGYRRHIVGKWHLGNHKAAYTPTARGFETHLGHWGGYRDYYDATSEIGIKGMVMRGRDLRRNMEPATDKLGVYATDLYTSEALKIIQHHDPTQSPLFLYVAHAAVHAGLWSNPLQAPRDVIQLFSHIRDPQRRIYAAMVYLLDRSVGKIVKALEDKGMLKNSIIVFSTDNGGPAGGINRNAASNWPLRGTKATGWEGGVRGVGFIWSPWLKSSGRVSNQLMHMVDWLPTLFSAAGGPLSLLGPVDGIDMWAALSEDTPSPRKEILLDLDPILGKSAIRVGNWKLVNGTWENGTYDTWFGPSGHEDKSYYEITTLKCSSNSSDKYCSNQTPNKQSFRNFMKTGVKRGNGKTFPISRRGTVRPMLDIRRLIRHHQNPKRFSAKRDPRLVVAVDCGEKPMNASTNCVPTESPCLFDLASDPCEYNNLASQYPGVVDELWRKLMAYQAASVEPINTPSDPLANPKYWGYFWSNWKDFS